MVKFQIEVAGKKYNAYLDYNDYEEISKKLQPTQKTGYERAEANNEFYEEEVGQACCTTDFHDPETDDFFYESANYYTDEKVAANNVRADMLMRKLRRFAAEHGGMLPLNTAQESYFIFMCDAKLGVNRYGSHDERLNRFYAHFGDILFTTRQAAEAAINTFRDELIWYFTQYKPMPEGWKYGST